MLLFDLEQSFHLIIWIEVYNLIRLQVQDIESMSDSVIAEFKKADIAFYRGYQNYRSVYRKEIVIHLFITLAFVAFIPIDAKVLETGDKIIAAEAVALAAAVISIICFSYMHFVLFNRQGVVGYCRLAKDTLHATEEPLTVYDTLQMCTSETMLDSPSGVLIEGVPEKTIKIYVNMAEYHMTQVNEHKINLSCWQRIQYFCGISAMIVVIVLMAASDHINAAEIAVLVCYLVLEAYSKWKLMVFIVLIALSPLLCMIFCCFVCFCAQRQGVNTLDLLPVQATSDHVVKSDGECSICLMSINPGENVYQLPCSQKHIFHMGCLDKWTRMKLTCPNCRAAMPMKEVAGQADVRIEY